jgi:hypothetical protein
MRDIRWLARLADSILKEPKTVLLKTVIARRAVIASEAKQSIWPRKERMDCFVAEPVIGRRFAPTRWLLAMTAVLSSTIREQRAL